MALIKAPYLDVCFAHKQVCNLEGRPSMSRRRRRGQTICIASVQPIRLRSSTKLLSAVGANRSRRASNDPARSSQGPCATGSGTRQVRSAHREPRLSCLCRRKQLQRGYPAFESVTCLSSRIRSRSIPQHVFVVLSVDGHERSCWQSRRVYVYSGFSKASTPLRALKRTAF